MLKLLGTSRRLKHLEYITSKNVSCKSLEIKVHYTYGSKSQRNKALVSMRHPGISHLSILRLF